MKAQVMRSDNAKIRWIGSALIVAAVLVGGLRAYEVRALDAPQAAAPTRMAEPLASRASRLAAQMGLTDECVLIVGTATVGSYEPALNCIVLSASLGDVDDSELAFVIAHEAAHRELEHATQLQGEARAMMQLYGQADAESGLLQASHHAIEFEADEAAMERLQAHGLFSLQAVERSIGHTRETLTHPAGAARVAALAATQRVAR